MNRTSRGKWFAVVLGSALAWSAAVSAGPLDDLRRQLDERVPEKLRALLPVDEPAEIRAGQTVAANMLGVTPLVPDERLQRYVNRVGRWVASQSERPDLPWHFGVIDTADVNAFAAPGGYVLVTRGLYARLADESELAGVLAHEIAHVVKRHHLNLMRKSLLIAEGSEALHRELKDRDQLVRNLVGNGAEIFARRLDKSAEFEADRMAVILAARAGYDPYGLPAALQKIGSVAESDDRVALLFSTHPLPDVRLRRLNAAMGAAMLALGGQGGELYPLQ